MSNSSIAVDVNKFLKLLPRYQCHKQVNALQISGIFPNPRGIELHFVDDSVIPFQMTQDWYNKHVPHVGGYLVAYDDGYLSFSPADVFHAGYSRMDEVGTDEDILEKRFWQFDAARKESGDERYVFKGFMRSYAARGVTKHTVGDVGVAHSNPAEAPQFAWSSQAALDVVAKRRYLIEYEGIDYGVEDDLSSGELAEAADCYLRYFGNATPKYWPLSESLWKPSARRENLVTAAALIIAEIERRDRAGCAPSVEALEIADVEDIAMHGDSSAVPVVMDGIIPATTKAVDIWDTLKDLGRLILCEIKMRDDPIAQALNGKRAYFSCGEKFTWDSPYGLLTEYYLRPVDDAIAEAFVSFGLVDRNEKPCIASGDVVVLTEGFAELAAPVSIRQLEPAVLPAQIVCYGAQDLYSRSSALTALGNVNLGDQQNLAILYSECLGIAATENLDFLQLIYFLDIGVRALFRVRGYTDELHHRV